MLLCRCGTVVVDLPGAYLTAALRLTDCVHLQLPAGVTLLAGDKVRSCGCSKEQVLPRLSLAALPGRFCKG